MNWPPFFSLSGTLSTQNQFHTLPSEVSPGMRRRPRVPVVSLIGSCMVWWLLCCSECRQLQHMSDFCSVLDLWSENKINTVSVPQKLKVSVVLASTSGEDRKWRRSLYLLVSKQLMMIFWFYSDRFLWIIISKIMLAGCRLHTDWI